MEKIGFIQKGEQVSVRDIDDMLRQYVEPVEVEVFHYTRKWLQKMTAVNIGPVGGADQDGPADRPAGQAGDPDAGDRLAWRSRVSSTPTCPSEDLRRTGPRLRRRRLSRPARSSRAGRTGAAKRRRFLPCRLSCARHLTWTSARTLARNDRAAVEDLAAPHAPRLGAFQRRGQALPPDRAVARTAPWRAPGRLGLSANHRSGSPT